MEAKVFTDRTGVDSVTFLTSRHNNGIRYKKKVTSPTVALRPKGYQYPLSVIAAALHCRLTHHVSFRQIGPLLFTLGYCLQAFATSTLLDWLKKVGYANLHAPLVQRNDWVLMLDESIAFGNYKLLLILGLPQAQLPTDRPLQQTDMRVLYLGAQTSWTGDQIAVQLARLTSRLGAIQYAVADGGHNIKKALRQQEIPYIYDLSHYVALYFKHTYAERTDYLLFTQAAAACRRYQSQSIAAALLPPRQKKKARYMNLGPLSQWGLQLLTFLTDTSEVTLHPLQERMQWVADHQPIIRELHQMYTLYQQVAKPLKKWGLGEAAQRACAVFWQDSTDPLSPIAAFQQHLQTYVAQQPVGLSEENATYLCSSDIIESIFGQYKHYLPTNAMAGITDTALVIPALTTTLSEPMIKASLEQVSTQELRKWTQTHFAPSILAQRRRLLPKKQKIDKNAISINGEVKTRLVA